MRDCGLINSTDTNKLVIALKQWNTTEYVLNKDNPYKFLYTSPIFTQVIYEHKNETQVSALMVDFASCLNWDEASTFYVYCSADHLQSHFQATTNSIIYPVFHTMNLHFVPSYFYQPWSIYLLREDSIMLKISHVWHTFSFSYVFKQLPIAVKYYENCTYKFSLTMTSSSKRRNDRI